METVNSMWECCSDTSTRPDGIYWDKWENGNGNIYWELCEWHDGEPYHTYTNLEYNYIPDENEKANTMRNVLKTQ